MKRSLTLLAFVAAALTLAGTSLRNCVAAAPPAAAPTASVREQFRQLIFKDRRPTPFQPQVVSKMESATVRTERVKISIEEGQSAVAIVSRPKEAGKYPAVIVQHYLGGSKDVFLFGSLLGGLAQKGFVAVAIDGRYRGERQNGKSLEAAMAESLRTGKGHPWLIDTAYDVLRVVDYLQTRDDVDPNRIGMTGISEGGILTWMCSSIDDRIKVAAPIIGVTCFAEALDQAEGPELQARVKLFQPALSEFAKSQNQPDINGRVLKLAWERLIPGALDRFDGPSLVPEIAPRPLLILNHEKDEIIPVGGARKVYEATEKRYKQLNAADRLEFHVAPGLKHTDVAAILGEANMMVQWMDRWLKAPAN